MIAPPPTIKTAEDLLLDFERTGDPSSFEEVVRRYTGMVYGVCYRVTRNAHDAEDAAQAVFLKLATQTRSGAGVPRVGPWLQQVARTTAVDLRRSRTRRTNREQVKAALIEQQSGHADATEDVSMDELKQLLRDEVDQLPVHYRTPLVLYYFGGLSTEQIACELKTNAKALAVRLFRGRKLLAGRLSDRGVAVGALGGGAVLSLAVVDAILAAMANASFSAPGGAAAVYGAASAGGGSAAWVTSHTAIFASIVERVSAVTRACALVGAAGKWKLSAVGLLMVGSAMAATSDAVQQHPAIQRMSDLLGTVKKLMNQGGGLTPTLQGPMSPLRADAGSNREPIALPPTVVLPPGNVAPFQPFEATPLAGSVRYFGVQPGGDRPGNVSTLDLLRRPSMPQASGSSAAAAPVAESQSGRQAVTSMGATAAIARPRDSVELGRAALASNDTSGAPAGESASAGASARLFGNAQPGEVAGPVASAADLQTQQAMRAALSLTTKPPVADELASSITDGLASAGGPARLSPGAAPSTAGESMATLVDGGVDSSLGSAIPGFTPDGEFVPGFGTPGDIFGTALGGESGFGASGMIPAPSANPIPEPTGVAVLATAAAIGLLARRRRR